MSILMLSALFFVIISAVTCGGGNGGGLAPVQTFLKISNYVECEGKDAGSNLTIICIFSRDQVCSFESGKGNNGVQGYNGIVQTGPNHQKAVDSVQVLAVSIYPAGAYDQHEKLMLVTGGPLAGKYVYEKTIELEVAYLKKCSSILGYSYVTSKSSVLLISDKLDLNVLLSPTGAFDAFKKGCTTVCTGSVYIL